MLKLERASHYLSSVIDGLGRAVARRYGQRGAIHQATFGAYPAMGGHAAQGMVGWHVGLESHDGHKVGTAWSRPLCAMTPDEAMKFARDIVAAAAAAAARSNGGDIRDGRLAAETASKAFCRTFSSARRDT